jgi:hypothetical protein
MKSASRAIRLNTSARRGTARSPSGTQSQLLARPSVARERQRPACVSGVSICELRLPGIRSNAALLKSGRAPAQYAPAQTNNNWKKLETLVLDQAIARLAQLFPACFYVARCERRP